MRWLVLVTATVLGMAGIAVAQVPEPGVSGKKLTVTPATGKPSTRFVLQFTTTSSTVSGTSGGMIRTVVVRAAGPGRANGCKNRVVMAVSVPRPGLQHVTLSPGRARWCPGAFGGSVTETIRPSCQPGVMCPQYIQLETIGTFSYKVT